MRKLQKDYDWIDIGNIKYEFHPSFENRMREQLAEKANELIGDKFSKYICCLIISNEDVQFDNNGYGYLKGDLIGWNNVGNQVTVAWSLPNKKKVYPFEDVEEAELCFYWCKDFPIEDIKKINKKKTFKAPSEKYSFGVEYGVYLGPDIFLNIYLKEPSHKNVKPIVEKALEEALANCKDPIHYIGELKEKDEGFSIHIDLGNCDTKIIESIIQVLDNYNKDINIQKILLNYQNFS